MMNRRDLFRLMVALPAVPVIAKIAPPAKIVETPKIEMPLISRWQIKEAERARQLEELKQNLFQLVEHRRNLDCVERTEIRKIAEDHLAIAASYRLIYDYKVVTDTTLYGCGPDDYEIPRMVVYLKKTKSVEYTVWAFGPPDFTSVYGRFWA